MQRITKIGLCCTVLAFLWSGQLAKAQFGIRIGPGGGVGIGVYSGPRRGIPYTYRGYGRGYPGSPYYRGYGRPYPYYYGRRSYGWGIQLNLSRGRDYTYDDVDDGLPADSTPATVPNPPIPTPRELELLPAEELVRIANVGAKRLLSELKEVDQGQSWIDYLSLEELLRRTAQFRPVNRKWLLAATRDFDKTKANSKFAAISSMWGFQVVHVALTEYSRPDQLRLRRQLQIATTWLESSLQEIGATNQGWIAFLELNELKKWLAEKPQTASRERARATTALKPFKQVAAEAKYQAIHGLAAFKKLSELLGKYGQAPARVPIPPAVPAPPAPEKK